MTWGEGNGLKSQGSYLDPPQFYSFLQNRVVVLFRPKFGATDADQPEFSLALNKTQNHETVGYHLSINSTFYDRFSQMAIKVGERLKHDPIRLRFTSVHADGKTQTILKRGLNQGIADIISPCFTPSAATVILYEKLDISVTEVENRRCVRVTWTGLDNEPKLVCMIMLPETSMVHDLVWELSELVQLTPTGTGRLRVFGVAKDGGNKTVYTGSELIRDIPDSVELFGEEIPRELVL